MIEDVDTQIIKHRVLVSDVVEQHREIREEIVALRAAVWDQSVPVAQPHPPPAVPPDAPPGRADVDRMCVPDAEMGNETEGFSSDEEVDPQEEQTPCEIRDDGSGVGFRAACAKESEERCAAVQAKGSCSSPSRLPRDTFESNGKAGNA